MPCTSSTGNNKDCGCEQFVPKRSKEHHCQNCGHHHTSYLTTPPYSEQEERELVRLYGPNYTERVYKSSKATGIFKKARKETLQDYWPSFLSNPVHTLSSFPCTLLTLYIQPEPLFVTGKGKAKAKAKQMSAWIPSQNQDIGSMKIGRIIFFPCGDQVPLISPSILFNKWFWYLNSINIASSSHPLIQLHWVRVGLAIEADPKTKDRIIFQLEWGSKQFHAFLHCLFPKLFDYLDTISPGLKTLADETDNVGTRKIDYTLSYVFLQKDCKKYHSVDATHPTALKYREYTSNEGGASGFCSKSIFLGTCSSSIASQNYWLTLNLSHKESYSTRYPQLMVCSQQCSYHSHPTTNCYWIQKEEAE